MFGNDDMIPRTYSIKGYKRRESIKFKRFLKVTFYIVLALIVIGISLLSAARFI